MIRLVCDICGKKYKYPEGLTDHSHPEFDIGGVPVNIWTLEYDLKFKGDLSDLAPFGYGSKQYDVGNTPLNRTYFMGARSFNVYIKDESVNPTGSFKDRGFPFLLYDAKKSLKLKVAIPSTGNAAISLVYFSRFYQIEPIVFIPETTEKSKKRLLKEKAEVIEDKDLVRSYEHFINYCRRNPSIYNGLPVSNLSYLQGIKSISFEIFKQLGRAPDWVIIPCGSGANIVGQYEGFRNLFEIGLIKKIPRLVPVQILGADPITVGFTKKNFSKVMVLKNPTFSRAKAIASDTCFNYFKIMKILRATNSLPVSVTDLEIEKYAKIYPGYEFSSLSVFAALEKIKTKIDKNETVVLVVTAINRDNVGKNN
ncbi:MAG: Pyridoxal-5'-phosphate-dependent enzyme, beta subunit [Microgenomates bacterium 39_6]|nr:MAG: Pyridoxal-5'-phosphate-dependent enzyme, beta subunit [Microgenomates bacterium 39_6]